jgi:hypothetical protein
LIGLGKGATLIRTQNDRELTRAKKLRIYVDTSVFGGCFDEEFLKESLALFEEIKSGKFILIISSVTTQELSQAPETVRQVLANLPPERVEIIPDSPDIWQL